MAGPLLRFGEVSGEVAGEGDAEAAGLGEGEASRSDPFSAGMSTFRRFLGGDLLLPFCSSCGAGAAAAAIFRFRLPETALTPADAEFADTAPADVDADAGT